MWVCGESWDEGWGGLCVGEDFERGGGRGFCEDEFEYGISCGFFTCIVGKRFERYADFGVGSCMWGETVSK